MCVGESRKLAGLVLATVHSLIKLERRTYAAQQGNGCAGEDCGASARADLNKGIFMAGLHPKKE